MKIAAIDYSMTCPSVTTFSGGPFTFENTKSYFRTSTNKYVGQFGNIKGTEIQEYKSEMERYINHAQWVLSIVRGCDMVAIEGYSMGSRGKVFHIAENTAILKYILFQNNIPFITVPPTRVKKHACKGNASKEEMYEAFVKLTKSDLKKTIEYSAKKIASPIGDIVDSFFICKYLHDKGE
jgi:hypothetical protein